MLLYENESGQFFSKGKKTMFICIMQNTNQTKLAVAMFPSDKINFRTRKITSEKKNLTMMKRSVHQKKP